MFAWKKLWILLWILIWIYCYLLSRTGLNLHYDNSCSIQKIPNSCTNNITISFFTYYTWSDLGKLDLLLLVIYFIFSVSVLLSLQLDSCILLHLWHVFPQTVASELLYTLSWLLSLYLILSFISSVIFPFFLSSIFHPSHTSVKIQMLHVSQLAKEIYETSEYSSATTSKLIWIKLDFFFVF